MATENRILLERIGNPDVLRVDGYMKVGGYQALKKVLKEMSPQQVQEEVKASGLRGRGGAGFPTALKWSFIPKDTKKPVYLCCNADESEPGTCKDRIIIEQDPHSMLEGMLIASYAIGCQKAFIYIRGEFHYGAEILQKAMDDARSHGLIGENILGSDFSCDIVLYRGAGAYICGEETGLLSSLEGDRGYPRNKPPFPAVAGLYQCPTIVNNVETLAALPPIIQKGGEWYSKLGSEKSTGTKLLSISGHVNKPDVYEVELGTMTLREFIDDIAGGVPGNRKIKGVIPGGSSMPVLREEQLDVNLTFEDLQEVGSSLGSGAIIVMDETVDMVEMAFIIAKFYAHESCGQCTPCREGNRWFVQILESIQNGTGRAGDIEQILSICDSENTSICPLWQAAVWPLRGFINQFREEFEAKIKELKKQEKPSEPVTM